MVEAAEDTYTTALGSSVVDFFIISVSLQHLFTDLRVVPSAAPAHSAVVISGKLDKGEVLSLIHI